MEIQVVRPWEFPQWDRFVASHPGGTVYHTSVWCRIVSEIGGYSPVCLIGKTGSTVNGVLPLLHVKSRLTGDRLVSLPFSDVCFPLAEKVELARVLLETAVDFVRERNLGYLEIRGHPAIAGDGGDPGTAIAEALGFATRRHFRNYVVPLTENLDALRKSFHKTAVRQTINKSHRLGAVGRIGSVENDLEAFYRLYALNRKRHGIPPQPRRLFSVIFERMREEPKALLYLVEFEGRPVAGLIVFRYRRVAYAKYEGVDDAYRHVLPIYALLWKSIEDAALQGDEAYDFGRTAVDNAGLNGFKSRWGTRAEDLPYLFYPPKEGLSVVKSDSLKYRIFTGFVRRLPLSVSTRVGAKFFRHFG